jgi:murein DD-endopeptidase MepM/ murein hydrolase activator NlpD
LDRYRTYDGRRSVIRRRHTASAYSGNGRNARRAIKLFICVGLFVVAALMKLLFPSALTAVGNKLNSVVNYKAALTSLGEGISGEKKFTTALGEAFTYAFTGETTAAVSSDKSKTDSSNTTPQKTADTTESAAATNANAAGASSEGNDTASAVPNNKTNDNTSAASADVNGASASSDTEVNKDASAADKEDENSNAVIAAFMQSQKKYSDYAIPAGVTYEMPKISIPYASPLAGVVSSSFGYRIHPVEKVVKFHYGTDIAAKKGTTITAFTAGKVISEGENTSFGKYVIISNGDIESEYAHCGSVSVKSGQTIKLGQKIATVGATGNATEPCLHFEIKVDGQYVNPEYYVQWK